MISVFVFFFLMIRRPPRSTLFPYTTLFRSLDRFGPPPAEAEQLFDIVHLRVAARSLGVEKLEAGEGVALVTFAPGTPLDPRRLVRAIEGSRGRLKMKREFTIQAVGERGERGGGPRPPRGLPTGR